MSKKETGVSLTVCIYIDTFGHEMPIRLNGACEMRRISLKIPSVLSGMLLTCQPGEVDTFHRLLYAPLRFSLFQHFHIQNSVVDKKISILDHERIMCNKRT